ncbi:MAG TPA: hypothetical protein VJ742_06380 [Nitrososphaera sp.]|nr:hypothetical protein [Nitrososphaera sp.]
MYAVSISLVLALLFSPFIALAQSQEYELIKTDRSETFVFPYSAANRDLDDPLIYNYDSPKGPSWILSIANNLTYAADESAKTIIRIKEPAPSEKFIEIAMYGGDAMKFWIAVNLPGTGYARLYSNDVNGWSTESAISISHAATAGLSITDGKRIIIDRFDMDGFNVGSVSVYGKDETTSPANAHAGDIRFDILFGSFEDSPLYLIPAIATGGIGGIIAILLIVKRRKPSD